MQARAVLEAMPQGNYAFIKGSSSDPNADFLFGGQMEVLQEAMDAGKIVNVGEAYTDGWKPENAQRNMEQILTANETRLMRLLHLTMAPPAALLQHLPRKAWMARYRFLVRMVTMRH